MWSNKGKLITEDIINYYFGIKLSITKEEFFKKVLKSISATAWVYL